MYREYFYNNNGEGVRSEGKGSAFAVEVSDDFIGSFGAGMALQNCYKSR